MTKKLDWDSIRKQLFIDKIDATLHSHPKTWSVRLQEMGMTWYDDEQEQWQPETIEQEYLVSYFNGHIAFSTSMIAIFVHELEADDVNYALFEYYFRTGNLPLLQLIRASLHCNPCNEMLLSAYVAYHEYHPMLTEVIDAYTRACQCNSSDEEFMDIVYNFAVVTEEDGYDAIAALQQLFADNVKKLSLLKDVKYTLQSNDSPLLF